MATFVLISGAWHSSWCWERVAPLLEAEGHTVITPDLLGMGTDTTPLARVSLAKWSQQVAQIVCDQPEPVVLVGHSRGGIVISEAAERAPDAIATLVYVAAFLLRPEETLMGAASLAPDEGRESPVIDHGDGAASIAPALLGERFYNTTAPEWVERASKQVGREPMAVFFTPLKLTNVNYGRTPRAYIQCEQDRAVSPALQRRMQELLPCDPVISMDTDHSPFFSAPEALVGHLMAIAAGLHRRPPEM